MSWQIQTKELATWLPPTSIKEMTSYALFILKTGDLSNADVENVVTSTDDDCQPVYRRAVN